jgi:hypothetical protein
VVVLPVETLRRWLAEHAEAGASRVDSAVQEILGDLSK